MLAQRILFPNTLYSFVPHVQLTTKRCAASPLRGDTSPCHSVGQLLAAACTCTLGAQGAVSSRNRTKVEERPRARGRGGSISCSVTARYGPRVMYVMTGGPHISSCARRRERPACAILANHALCGGMVLPWRQRPQNVPEESVTPDLCWPHSQQPSSLRPVGDGIVPCRKVPGLFV
eukprot:gene14569-biopygen14194